MFLSRTIIYAMAGVLLVLVVALFGQHLVLLSTKSTLERERATIANERAAAERAGREASERHQADLVRWGKQFREIEDVGRARVETLANELAATRSAGDSKLHAAQRMLDDARAAASRSRASATPSVASGCDGTEAALDLSANLLGWARTTGAAAREISVFAEESADARDACQLSYEVTQ